MSATPAAPAFDRGRFARFAFVLANAIAMGWFEAVVVVYIRGLVGIQRHETIPPPDETLRRMATVPWLLQTEQTRELATMVMLIAVGYLAAHRWRARLGAYLISFGVWDIAYYAALWVMLRWPPSLLTRDLLFLIPAHPWWYQPVWLPVAISSVMIAVGAKLFFASDPRTA